MPKFPFTNYHELNLDWILKKVNALFDASEENARTIRTYDTRLTRAEQTATNAETAATSAQQLADAAAANADNALSVAGTADAKADSALTAATNAAGAASGALTTAQEARQIAGNAQSAAADAGALANDASNVAAAAQQTADTNAGNIATLQTAVDNKADVIISSASGSIASFADGADDMPIKSLIVNIEPVQAGSGDPSPTNIRPITGRTAVTIYKTLNNIAANATFLPGYYADDGSIAGSAASTTRYELEYMPVESGGNYIIIGKSAYSGNARIRVHEYSSDYTWLRQSISISISANSDYKINYTPSANAAFIRVSIPNFNTPLTIAKLDSMAISWQPEAGIVYGGTLDAISGLLRNDSELFTLDGTANIYKATQNFFSTDKFNSVADTSKEVLACNKLPVITPSEIYTGGYGINFNYTGNGFLWFNSSVFDGMSAEQVKTWLASNPIQFVARKINVQTYQLTPQQINTVLGMNKIWTDVGPVDVEYPADTKLYIDGKIAELQALVLEN